MPSSYPTLDRATLREVIARELFAAGASGAEHFALSVELLPMRRGPGPSPEPVPPGAGRREPGLRHLLVRWPGVDQVDVRASGAVLPGRGGPGERGRLTFGPGAQLGYGSALHETPAAAFEDVARVLDGLAAHLSGEGVELVALGADPWHDPEAVGLQGGSPVLACLDEVVAANGEMGRRALLLSAGTRVRLAHGGPVLLPLRWRAAQLLAPLFTAIFANSPLRDGGHEGTKSLRGRARRLAEPTRTGFPAPFCFEPGADPVEQYLEFALDARVVGLPDGERWTPQTGPLTFGDWVEKGVARRYPELEDWRLHLATLLPEVLPLGALELESADALPRAFWSVPLTLWTALLCDPERLTEVIEVLTPTAGELADRWEAASRQGLVDPELREQASWLFAAAADSLLRLPGGWISDEMLAAFVAFGRRYALRGLTPADELLDLFLERGGFGLREWGELDRRSRPAGARRLDPALA